MGNMNRRTALRVFGTTSGGLALAGAAGALGAGSSPAPAAGTEWAYRPLSPTDIAGRAYTAYAGNGCMYAVVSAIVGALADQQGEPYASFPLAMMKYGHGGVGGYGSLCGALNGAAAMIGLFHGQQRTRDLLATELFKWYEQAELPRHQPTADAGKAAPVTSKSGSVLCHASIANWCRKTGGNPYDKARGERCRRLSADVAAKTVELLNRTADGGRQELTVTDGSAQCMQCHATSETKGVTVRSLMDCGSCHEMQAPHPRPRL